MALQHSTYRENRDKRNIKQEDNIELNVYERIEGTDSDSHMYITGAMDPGTGNMRNTATVATWKKYYRPICLALFGGIVFGAVVSAITSVVAYHVADERQNGSLTDVNRRQAILDNKVQALQERQNVLDQQVAFTVNRPTSIGYYNVLIFSNVVLNVGDSYNLTTGRFRCPVAGTYLFSTTLISSGNRTDATSCSIRKNSYSVTGIHIQEGNFDSASVSVLLHLVVGDFVDLGSCTNVDNLHGNTPGSIFLGSLIQAD